MKPLIVLFILLSPFSSLKAQDLLMGRVSGKENGERSPLAYASVYWAGTGQGTLTDSLGKFQLPRHDTVTLLVVSYTGFVSDSVETLGQNHLHITLDAQVQLGEVIIEAGGKATGISSLNNIKTEILTEKEFKKAACCNLSESFETNPTVEVSFSDALTGMRQIQLLGLSGIYAQTLIENVPAVRGLGAATGLTYIPGPFVESVHLAKGAGSVVYGFESMSGQINIDLKKPETGPALFLNGYVNMFGRSEANAVVNRQLNERWYTGVMFHANYTRNRQDPNNDGFYNMPSGGGINLINRWKYNGPRWEGMVGIRFSEDQRYGGQTGFQPRGFSLTNTLFGLETGNRQYGVWAKFGRPSNEKKPLSIGFIAHANRYENRFRAGLGEGYNRYAGLQNNFYGAWVANRSWKKEAHTVTGGLNILADDYHETLNQNVFRRTEIVPGVYGEYTYNYLKKFSLVLGLRGDYHNLFGFFATPRLHTRYAINENHTLRASAGRGQRTSNALAENLGLLASRRNLILPSLTEPAFGIRPEVSWNYGINYSYDFDLGSKRSGQFTLDYYYVHFINQAVIDLDASAREVRIYNLDGPSFSQTFQAQITLEPIKRAEVRIAYRYLDVRATYQNLGLLQKSLQSPHRGFVNLSYETKKRWTFDLTAQFNGRKRLPMLKNNPEHLQWGDYSPVYTILHAQVSKTWRKWEFYLGGENLLNVMQHHLIMDAGNPAGSYFDASMVWGPAMGAMAYAGFRYTIK